MLTTVCDACGTEFRVTAEQLKPREGRVRCGKCNTIFNALSTLTVHEDRGEPGLMTLVDPEIPNAMTPEATQPAPQAEEPALTWPTIDPAVIAETQPPEEPLKEPPEAMLVESVETMAPIPLSAVLPEVLQEEKPATKPPGMPAAGATSFDFGPKPAVHASRWWKPLASLLFLTLLAQAVFYFRGAIAFMLPETKPYISEFCAELRCEVPLPRRSELISIETSDLQTDPTNPGVIVLLATLRNRAAFPQTFPAIELTLTNDRDQPLARRVLNSGDYLADKVEAFEGSSEKQVRLIIEAGSLKASGYRLYLFYP